MSIVRDIRVCLDLNVWIRRLLNFKAGKTATASQRIFDFVSAGRYANGGVQIVISYTMLSRLEAAIAKIGVAPAVAHQYVSAIEAIARIGAYREPAAIVLGGGFNPTRDSVDRTYNPYDDAFFPDRIDAEDGRVLDTALAGGADLLVTNNMKDFAIHSDEVVGGRVRIKTTANRRLVLVDETDGLSYLDTAAIPGIGDILSADFPKQRLPRSEPPPGA